MINRKNKRSTAVNSGCYQTLTKMSSQTDAFNHSLVPVLLMFQSFAPIFVFTVVDTICFLSVWVQHLFKCTSFQDLLDTLAFIAGVVIDLRNMLWGCKCNSNIQWIMHKKEDLPKMLNSVWEENKRDNLPQQHFTS